MDGGDVALAIRRARRSNAKNLDLSCRGLQAWPEDLFSLQQLETLDLSSNELTAVNPNLTQLELLEELNLSGNKLSHISAQHIAGLQSLRSLLIDGNPVASQLPTATVRQLAHPPRTPGQTPVQVICSLLSQASQPTSSFARPPPPPRNDHHSEFNTTEIAPPPPPPPPPVANFLSQQDDIAPWRKEQKGLLAEIERLQARVDELEGQLGSPGGGGRLIGGSSTPSWLQDKKASLSSTLPSRRGSLDDSDEASVLRQQLQEEQRKSKRLEQQVQRLTDRLKESDVASSGMGSLPHFELPEVEFGDIINQGGFSVVHKGSWHGTKVAVKKLFDPNISAELLAEFDNEVQKLEQIRHPNILMALALHRKPPALSLIMELVEGGSFYQLLHSPQKFNFANGPIEGGLPMKDTMEILESSGVAIAFLHGRGIAHRDVKSQNVLLSPHLEVKLCDFGLARLRSEMMTGTMQFAGTPNYMAPEIFRNQKYTENVDVFAYGTMVWEAVACDIPWANMDPADIRDRVIAGQMLQIPISTPPGIQQVIQVCWTMDNKLRPNMEEVLAQLRDFKDGGAARTRRPRTAGAARDALGSTGGFAGGALGGTGRLGR